MSKGNPDFKNEGKGMANSKTKVMPVRADKEILEQVKIVRGEKSANQWVNEAIKEKLERELGK